MPTDHQCDDHRHYLEEDRGRWVWRCSHCNRYTPMPSAAQAAAERRALLTTLGLALLFVLLTWSALLWLAFA